MQTSYPQPNSNRPTMTLTGMKKTKKQTASTAKKSKKVIPRLRPFLISRPILISVKNCQHFEPGLRVVLSVF